MRRNPIIMFVLSAVNRQGRRKFFVGRMGGATETTENKYIIEKPMKYPTVHSSTHVRFSEPPAPTFVMGIALLTRIVVLWFIVLGTRLSRISFKQCSCEVKEL